MSERHDIEIAIHPDGTLEYTIKGMKGSGCENISALLEKLGQVTHEEKTGEYYEQDSGVNINIS
jgi:hypothetical protein